MPKFLIHHNGLEAGSMCYLRVSDSQLLCWGSHARGALGIDEQLDRELVRGYGEQTPAVFPDYVEGVIEWSSSGQTVCAITKPSRLLFCWGDNSQNQVMQRQRPFVEKPIPFVFSSRTLSVISVAIASKDVCAILEDDQDVWCWGERFSVPTKMSLSTSSVKPIKLAAGTKHHCALFDNDKVKCFGSNYNLEVSPTLPLSRWVKSDFLDYWGDRRVSSMHLGSRFSCFHFQDKTLVCNGRTSNKEIGIQSAYSGPKTFDFFNETFEMVRAGSTHVCVVDQHSRVLCHGSNSDGRLGMKAVSGPIAFEDPEQRQVQLRLNVTLVDMHLNVHGSCFYSDQDEIFCVGTNTNMLFGTSVTNTILDPSIPLTYDPPTSSPEHEMREPPSPLLPLLGLIPIGLFILCSLIMVRRVVLDGQQRQALDMPRGLKSSGVGNESAWRNNMTSRDKPASQSKDIPEACIATIPTATISSDNPSY